MEELLEKKIKETWEYLHQAQVTNNSNAEHELQQKLEILMIEEKQYWWQCSRINQIQASDRHTSYFHRKATNMRRRNFIVFCLQWSSGYF